MSENLNEEKMVEAEVVNEEKVEEKENAKKTSATSAEISVEPTTKSNDFMKKLIPIISTDFNKFKHIHNFYAFSLCIINRIFRPTLLSIEHSNHKI